MLASEHFENLIKKMGGNPDTLPAIKVGENTYVFDGSEAVTIEI